MKRILGYLKPLLGRMLTGFGIKLAGTVMDLAIPWILAHIIDEIVPTGDKRAIFLWGAGMALCAVIALAGNVVANRRASAVSRDATRRIRHDLFEKVEHLSARQMDELTVPSLISRLTSDTYNVNQTLGRMQRLGVRAPILLTGGIIVTMLMDFRLSLVLLATLPLLTLGVALISRRGLRLYGTVQQNVDRMVRTVRDDITGIRVIRALSKGDYECAHFQRDSEALSRSQIHADSVMAATNPMMQLLLNLGLTAVVVCGSYWVDLGLTKPGSIIAFLTYFTIILNAMMSVNKMFVMLSQAAASADRIAEVLNLPDEVPQGGLARLQSQSRIVFKDVCFSYAQPARGYDLGPVTLSVGRGETLGVIGATGSGKTTLIQLLQRFYPLDEGAIYVDGENIAGMEEARLHGLFGVAFQSDAFFAGTIYENIDLGRGLPREAIEKAVRCAQAEEFILATPEGYDHPVRAKAVNLSGGQKQRLLIARALAGNPEILILDDSSSALDYRTDAQMRAAVREEYPGTTILLVAQRVSSVKNADQILVLEEGHMAGLGTHEALLRDCPLYAQIAKIQMGGDDDAAA